MKFWKKYKAKKELRERLEKARFINFYGNEIDLNLGRIKELVPYNETTTVSSDFDDDYKIRKYYIILNYDNFKERYLSYNQDGLIRDKRIRELDSFADSDKFTQYLNNYENLKREYEQL
jgi:hypothetical protein